MRSCKFLFVLILFSFSCSRKYTLSSLETSPSSKMENLSGLKIIDRYDQLDGFYIFYKDGVSSKKPRQLIYFIHGLGAINPGIYGKWLRHLIDQSAVVVFPRYQLKTMSPLPSRFAETLPAGFHRSWNFLKDSVDVSIDYDDFHFIGHSYGGAAINYLCADLETYKIPKPKTIMACHPGTGPFSSMVLENYSTIPADIKLVLISAENDAVVGDKMASSIFKTAKQVERRVWIKHYEDGEGDDRLMADHRSPYCIDTVFDNRIMNGTARRAWNKSKYDAEDVSGFFKIGDELRNNRSDKSWLFDDTKQEWPLGYWPEGDSIRPFDLVHPEKNP